MSVDVCYIVSPGFVGRMLTQTDLLGRLRSAGQTVAVICPDRTDPVLAEYCARNDIQLEEFEPRKAIFSDDYLFRRRYYLEDIRSNPALWEKHLSATRFHPARNLFKRLRPYWYYLKYRLIPRFPWPALLGLVGAWLVTCSLLTWRFNRMVLTTLLGALRARGQKGAR